MTIWHITVGLILAKLAGELGLDWINRREVQAHAGQIPPAYEGIIDPETYHKSVNYTLAKNRFSQITEVADALILLLVLGAGVFPWIFEFILSHWNTSAWSLAAGIFVSGIALSTTALPLDWYSQFRLEARFGFNTSTVKTWFIDRIKGLLIGLALGYPLLVFILKIVDWTGTLWWLWAWAAVVLFQIILMVLAPKIILPWFNKFTDLPEGDLKERLIRLGEKTGFRSHSIQVMDGSRRSRHSNAFFTGFGRFRKIVLFDTLIEQLTPSELEAVLAHEIGHYRKKHILKMLIWSILSLLIGFFLIGQLAQSEAFYRAFGFPTMGIAPALLLFGLLSGLVTFWISPLSHFWSRRFEYQADAYARDTLGEADSLIGALRKLNEKNLSNLTPHPWYSAFYYSHPTLRERETALRSPASV